MWYYQMILVPVLLPTLVVKSYCDNTNSDVIVQYSGHAEADYPQRRILESPKLKDGELNSTTLLINLDTLTSSTKSELPEETQSVVFVPNDPPVLRAEDQYDRSPLKHEDLMLQKSINIQEDTEAPKDVVFIASKNSDHTEKSIKEETRRNNKKKGKIMQQSTSVKPDCTNLDCNNTINSICGEKIINSEIKHRLFMNECYFRKVNCNFKYEINRYSIVSQDKCKNIGIHYAEKPASYRQKYFEEPRDPVNHDARRSFSSRRSMSLSMNGQFCSHPCPISCPDDYEPECAVSSTGQRKVFMNHCKLDDNSCLYRVVWHRRPLSECVGGKKADMRQNRHFIDWMRRVGILDGKGKLVLE